MENPKMKVKEISVNVSKKIGMPNFSSVMLSASIIIEASEKNTNKAFKEAWTRCWKEVENQEKKLTQKYPAVRKEDELL